MKDPRVKRLAELLVNYSISLKPGENCLVESYDIPTDFLEEIVDAVYRAGGHPVLELKRNRLMRALVKGACAESLSVIRESELFRMKMMQAYIGIRGVTNPKELSDLPQ
ncbi:MAG TPA: aminopeptidase, partial [Spirochaetia bacterium]|nr:aminopeptidase [Spirochaetia bacterium]